MYIEIAASSPKLDLTTCSSGLGFRVWVLGFRVWVLGFRVLRVKGLGFRV